MPVKKLHIKIAVAAGWRGAQTATEMVDLLKENWDQIQSDYKAQEEQDKNDMYDYFNNEVEELGNNLFGQYANPEDLKRFVDALNDEDQARFFEVCKEQLQVDEVGTLESGDQQ